MKNGILNVLKPTAMTSNDVVMVTRRLLQEKKIGHAGTLDPNAAGVLPVCVGRATRFISYLEHDKRYLAYVRFGISTDTGDGDGQITAKSDIIPSETAVREAAASFLGDIQQIPPMVSAVKYNGQRLYDLARKGITVQREPRNVTVRFLKVEKTQDPQVYRLDVLCSKGTYIRTLCADIGDRLGCGGHMAFLLRTAVGEFIVDSALSLDEIGADTPLLPVEEGLLHLPRVSVPEKAMRSFVCGVPAHVKAQQAEAYRVYENERFLGVGNVDEQGLLRMNVWLDPPAPQGKRET